MVIKVFNNENLVEITTQRQKQNDTRQFFDRKNRVHYISYSSGYVRREIRTKSRRFQSLINPVHRYEVINYFDSVIRKSKVEKIHDEKMRLYFIDEVSLRYNGYSMCSKNYLI